MKIEPGALAGTRYKFENEADETVECRIPGDIVFELHEKPEKNVV